jgi:hypothetical protein
MYKITKIKIVENPLAETAKSVEDYRESLLSDFLSPSMNVNHLSPSIDYWVIGEILQQPIVGKSLIMDRWIRNGVPARGRFQTTEITELFEGGFKTMNSVYKIEEVTDKDLLNINNE